MRRTTGDLPIADEETVAAFAQAALGLDIPFEALPGVCANLVALADHWRGVEASEPPTTHR